MDFYSGQAGLNFWNNNTVFLFICIDSCPPDAAASLVEGIKCVSLGEVAEGPRWENGISTLKYINGELCPDKIRRKTTILRLKCDESKIVSRLLLVGFYVFFSSVICATVCGRWWSSS